jgi:N-hydroxyarylamine O-acetyltransferase
MALTDLGFHVERLAAVVQTGPNLPIGHKLLKVTIGNQQWIADVGFGGFGLFEPIPLMKDQIVTQYGDQFKLIQKNENYTLQIFDNKKGAWKDLYQFNLNVFRPKDFEVFSFYVSHLPTSIFVTNRICVMPRKEGRIILNNYDLKIITNGEEKNFKLQNDNEYYAILEKFFGISLSTGLIPITAASKNAQINNITNTSYNHFSTKTNDNEAEALNHHKWRVAKL